jgi:xylulose-5-phosphate/fructose-6-phosphate phosphoketolase
VVNLVDLMRLEPDSEHPHGLPDPEFDALFTTDTPVIFAYHGYASLIHRASALRQQMVDERRRHRAYTREVGDDPPDVRDWKWPGPSPAGPA